MLRKQREPQQRRVDAALRAVVAPDRGEDFPHALPLAGHQRGIRGAQSLGVVGTEAQPGPDAAGENRLAEAAVDVDVLLIKLFAVPMIVVPVDHLHILRHGLKEGRVESDVLAVVPAARVDRPEEHVAPHHRLQSQLARDLHHACQVLPHDLRARDEPVAIQILVPPQLHGFVHADVDAL